MNELDEEPFSYKIAKNKKVFIYWQEKQVAILKDKESEKFLNKFKNTSIKESQLAMTKITGDFKRAHEKIAKK